MVRRHPIQLVVLLTLSFLLAPAWGADRSCLTGDDPSVAVDAGQVATLEAQLAASCPCGSFDGSEGKTRRDYLRCVSPLIKAAVKSGDLRSKCKSRVGKAHKLSTCGAASSSGLVPCIESKSNGALRCRIKSAADCLSDGRYTRVACASYSRCVDAGDSNGDLQVAVGDSGACIVPPTATSTATPTTTFTPTPTATDTSTSTPTESPLPTEPPDFGWTFCADLDQACLLPGNREVRFGHGDVYVSKFITGTAVSCSYAVFDPHLEGEYASDPHCDYFIDSPTRTPTSTATATPTSTATNTATPEEGWVFCANEGGSCTMPSAYRLVRFGIPGSYFVEVGDSTLVECTVAAFGVDPAIGHAKRCEYSSSDEVLPTFTPTLTETPTSTATPTATPTPTSEVETWTHCADDDPLNFCNSPPNRMVRFGGPDRWVYHFSSGSILCSSGTWGDPLAAGGNVCEYSSFPYPTPTPTGTPAWVFCAHPGETCMLPGHDQLVSLGIPSPDDFDQPNNLITQVAESSIECSPEVLFPGSGFPSRDCYYLPSNSDYQGNPFGMMVTNRGGDFWDLRILSQLIDDPALTCSPAGAGGPCELSHPFSADFSNEIAVFAIDPRITESDDRGHLSYHWEIRYSPSAANGEAIYAPRGITGYFEPVLKINPQSMPSFEQLADKRWRLKLTITRQPHSDYPMSVAPFISTYHYSFLYSDSAISLSMAAACQLHENPDPSCQLDDLLRAPAGTY